PALAPSTVTSSATSVTANGAILNGSAIPNGDSTNGWFRYSASFPGACSDSFRTRVPASGGTALGSGNSAAAFSQPASGLLPATTYFYCAIGQNPAGTAFGSAPSFTTPPAAPAVTTSGATSLGGTSVTLNGSANPNGDATVGWFRYSTTNPGSCNDSFGTRVPASGGTALGSGLASISYSQPVTGLTMGTLYYYCAIAQNPEGPGFGILASF